MRQIHRAGEKVFVDFSGKKPAIVDAITGELTDVELFVGAGVPAVMSTRKPVPPGPALADRRPRPDARVLPGLSSEVSPNRPFRDRRYLQRDRQHRASVRTVAGLLTVSPVVTDA